MRGVEKLLSGNGKTSGVLLFLVLLLFASAVMPTHLPDAIYSDMAVYSAQSLSFAYDGDNKFDVVDYDRFVEAWGRVPEGIMLTFSKGNFYFAKPALYAILSVPFVLVLGPSGIINFNIFMTLVLIFFSFLYLSEYNSKRVALIVAICFYGLSFLGVYIWVVHADILHVFLLTLTLYMYHLYNREKKKSRNSYVSKQMLYVFGLGLFAGLLCYARWPFALFIAGIGLKLLIDKEYKPLISLACVTVVFFALPTLIHIFEIGQITAYSGNRGSFTANGGPLNGIPYGPEFDMQAYTERIAQDSGYKTAGTISNTFSGIASGLKGGFVAMIYDIGYYFVGRNTGIIFFMPFVLLLLFNINTKALRSKNWPIALAAVGNMIFWIVAQPNNYYGGAWCYGNRYFLQMSCCLIFLDQEIKINIKNLAIGCISLAIAIVFQAPSILKPENRLKDFHIYQNRYAFLCLPTELTILTHQQARVCLRDEYTFFHLNTPEYMPPATVEPYWLGGSGKSEYILVSKRPIESIDYQYKNGPIEGNVVTFSDGTSYMLQAWETCKKNLPVKQKAYLYGEYYYYVISIEYSDTFIPSETLDNAKDTRELGIHIDNYNINYVE